ncbi:unnamed protein product [Musa banksii]
MDLSAPLCHRVAMPKSRTQTIDSMEDSLKVHELASERCIARISILEGRVLHLERLLMMIAKLYNQCLRPR